jgi:hypothetical protein
LPVRTQEVCFSDQSARDLIGWKAGRKGTGLMGISLVPIEHFCLEHLGDHSQGYFNQSAKRLNTTSKMCQESDCSSFGTGMTTTKAASGGSRSMAISGAKVPNGLGCGLPFCRGTCKRKGLEIDNEKQRATNPARRIDTRLHVTEGLKYVLTGPGARSNLATSSCKCFILHEAISLSVVCLSL